MGNLVNQSATDLMNERPVRFEWPTVVTNLRIFSEGGDGWSIDGYNENTGEYTSQVLTYDTFAEAVSKLPDFVSYLREDGVRIKWRPTKQHHHHWESWGSYGDVRCAVQNCTAVRYALESRNK